MFDDQRLHVFTGGGPATADELRERFARQVPGRSPDGGETWLNWMLRARDTGELVGTVQATVIGNAAELAWVVAVPHQGRGYAREAAIAVRDRLRDDGATRFTAHIHPDHVASAGVARALDMTPSSTLVDGELRWADG